MKRCLSIICISSLAVMPLFSSQWNKSYDLPTIESVEDIDAYYPKSVEEINLRKERALDDYTSSVHRFITLPSKNRSFYTTVEYWDRIEGKLLNVRESFLCMALVEPDPAKREALFQASIEMKKAYFSLLSQTPEIYEILSQFSDNMKLSRSLTKEERYVLDEQLADLKLLGLHLSKEKREEFDRLQSEITEIEESFSKNIREDQAHVLAGKEELLGVNDRIVDGLSKSGDSEVKLTCDYPVFFPVMRSCQNAEIRKQLYFAFMNRAYPHNKALLEDMICKRDRLAKLVGFDSYTHMQLSNEMAKSPVVVSQFLNQMVKETDHKHQKELEELTKALPEEIKVNDEGRFSPWDVSYVQEKYISANFDVDQEEIREYFPLKRTIEGLFKVYESFFDLTLSWVAPPDLWHPDVMLVKVIDNRNDKTLGFVLLDLFPRQDKYTHACHGTFVQGLDPVNGKSTTGLSLIIANFPKPSESGESLLDFSSVKTFFHEFGHGLHAMFGRTEFYKTAGTNTKIDFVELPSQMLEEWLWDKDILKIVSSHYKTGKPMSDELIDKLIRTKTISTAEFVHRQAILSFLSMNLFAEGADKNPDVVSESLWKAYKTYGVFNPDTHSYASFGHLTEYGSRYYGYLWSRVFALDVFDQIKKEGLMNPVVGRRYAETILQKGGSVDPKDLLEEFLGREPSSDAFLRHYGLK